MNTPTPDAPATRVSCPQCATQLPCYNPASSRYFSCFKCRSYFWAVPEAVGKGQRRDGFRTALVPGPSLPLGTAVTLGGYHCRLTGYQVRGEKDDPQAEWREYQLTPATPLPGDELPLDFPLQLAEYQGHWLLIRRAATFPARSGPGAVQAKEWHDPATGRHYQLWHRYQPTIRDAMGEFDWDILEDEQLKIEEFSSPPYLLTSEQQGKDKPTWYLAEHLEPVQVADIFFLPLTALPVRQGIGAAQPGRTPDWPALKRLTVAAVFLLTVGQMLLSWSPTEQQVVQQFTIAEPAAGATTQMLVSGSFDLETATALEVELQAPDLANHWVEATVSLVNEQTGRGYEFTRSLEYYQGNEDGENWSEGNRTAEALLSDVPSGRYHFNLYPTVDPGTGTATLSLSATTGVTLWSNYFLALCGLGLVPFIVRWRRRSFEQERWENSNFNPYATAD
jgi:hypothetical protein